MQNGATQWYHDPIPTILSFDSYLTVKLIHILHLSKHVLTISKMASLSFTLLYIIRINVDLASILNNPSQFEFVRPI